MEGTISYAPFTRDSPESISLLKHLLEMSQGWLRDPRHVVELLDEEIGQLWHGKVRLMLHFKKEVYNYKSWMTYDVTCGGRMYGVLLVPAEPAMLNALHLSVPMVRLLADTCGLILSACEKALLLQVDLPPQQLESPDSELTPRQQEILALMGQGLKDAEIANKLHITLSTLEKHRQLIYAKLGVHSRQEAILVGYQRQLFSPLCPPNDKPPTLRKETKKKKKRKTS